VKNAKNQTYIQLRKKSKSYRHNARTKQNKRLKIKVSFKLKLIELIYGYLYDNIVNHNITITYVMILDNNKIMNKIFNVL